MSLSDLPNYHTWSYFNLGQFSSKKGQLFTRFVQGDFVDHVDAAASKSP
jgi:hypothetical protein